MARGSSTSLPWLSLSALHKFNERFIYRALDDSGSDGGRRAKEIE